MGRSIGRMSHLRNIIKERYRTESKIENYVKNQWLKSAQKVLTNRLTKGMKKDEKKEFEFELDVRTDKKYFIISMTGVDKKTLAFIDKKTGDILRPRFHTKPHVRYQPKITKSNINDSSGGIRYVRNINFKYLP